MRPEEPGGRRVLCDRMWREISTKRKGRDGREKSVIGNDCSRKFERGCEIIGMSAREKSSPTRR